MRAKPHERDFFGQACKHAQIRGNQKTSGRIDRQIHGAAKHNALQHACGIPKLCERFAPLEPNVTGIDQQAAVRMTRHRHFQGALVHELLAMATWHRHAALGIKRK